MLDVAKILEDLKQEKEQLEQAILTLERLAQGRAPRRGRPPSYMVAEGAAVPKRRGRPPGSKNKVSTATSDPTPKDSAVA